MIRDKNPTRKMRLTTCLTIAFTTAFSALSLCGAAAAQSVPSAKARTKTLKTDANPFRTIKLNEALDAAKSEGRIVMIDFYTDWCGFCKQLDRTTWKNEKVRNWLSEKTVSIKINAETDREISAKYRIESYPTILFLKSDGDEIDRLTGYKNAVDFMQDAAAALNGKDSAARAKEALLQNKGDSPDLRLKYIKALTDKGSYKEALDECLAFFDQEFDKGYEGTYAVSTLYEMERIGRKYKPAQDALMKRRDDLEGIIMAGKNRPDEVLCFAKINAILNDHKRTLAIYDRFKLLGQDTEALREQMGTSFVNLLIKDRRYNDILDDQANISKRVDSSIKNALSSRSRIFYDGINYYEALLGAGKSEEAAKLARQLMELKLSDYMFVELINRAVRAQDYRAAEWLAERAMESLPKEETAKIISAAARIPKDRLSSIQMIALQAHDGNFVGADPQGYPLFAVRPAAKEWETFKFIRISGGRVALQAHNGRYVSAKNVGYGLLANGQEAGDWEMFRLIELTNGRIALMAHNGQFVSVDSNGKLTPSGLHIKEHETFHLIDRNSSTAASSTGAVSDRK